MAPGAKSNNINIKRSTMKRTRWSRPVPLSLFSDLPSTSHNRFSTLADQDDMETEHLSNITEPKVSKPPPIVVDAKTSLKRVQDLLGANCVYKRTSIGTKVFPQNKECYEKCKKVLLENNVELHSFNSKENKAYTVFLHGLPKLNTNDIKKDIEGYNLSPVSITEINTQFSSVNNAVYKVQFARKNFNPKSLNNITAICNVIVSWKKYKGRKSDNPTQCWKCLMYGHGGDHCNRASACMLCANQHHTKDCPLMAHEKSPAAFSCFNCKKHGKERTDHSANDLKCPMRALYLETRAKATTRNPRGRINSNQQHARRIVSADQTMNHSSNVHTPQKALSYADCAGGRHDLFSIDELFNIFTTALADLQQCTTKIQQIHVVMSMVKYAYGLR